MKSGFCGKKFFSLMLLIFLMLSVAGCSKNDPINIGLFQLTITSANHTSFTEGTAGTFTFTATGTPRPTLTLTGALPAGVTFNAATGVLSGTPAAGNSGTYPLVFRASNAFSHPTQNFTLTVTTAPSAKAITAFSLNSVAGMINETAKTITVVLSAKTSVAALVATFTTTGDSIRVGSTVQASGITPNDFTNPVVYTVTAADATTQDYEVKVIVAAVNLSETGQTTCYDTGGNTISCDNTGQDGDLRKGVAWPNPRFTDNADQTVADNLTGLIWAKDGNTPGPAACGPGMEKTWQEAFDHVKCLNTNRYLGYDNWRLPNVNELESLIHAEKYLTMDWLNTQGFNNVQGEYWTSTTSYATTHAFIVQIATGISWIIWKDVSAYYYIWPVRDGLSGEIDLPITGQTICYDQDGNVIACAGTGQDGELQKGVIWPAPRFADNGDQTVIDKLTGLIWTKDGNAPGPTSCVPGVTKSWQGALDYVKCLNTNQYLGYNDWRLPNRKELHSMTNYGAANAKDWLNTQGFNNVQSTFYVSSTTYTTDKICPWIVNVFGEISVDGKSRTDYAVWPVRAGQ